MKKILILFSILVAISLFSQSYHVDTQCEILETQIKGGHQKKTEPRIISIFYSLKDNSFVAEKYTQSEIYLYDFEIKAVFGFNAVYYQNKTTLKFINVNYNNIDKDEINIKKITVDNLGDDNYLIKTYSREKAKKPNLEVKFKLKKSDYPLVKFRFLDMSRTIHDKIYDALLSKLPNPNFQIESVYSDYKKSYIGKHEVSKCQNVDLTFDLRP